MIMTMGFNRPQALKALKATANNVERAIDWIFSHAAELDNPSAESPPPPPEFRDGNGGEGITIYLSVATAKLLKNNFCMQHSSNNEFDFKISINILFALIRTYSLRFNCVLFAATSSFLLYIKDRRNLPFKF